MDLVARTVGNDTRGWILCIISGIACLFGASIICVDAIVRLFPGKRNFRIEESNVFLACSLSLSFGVMLFSSLYSMLPESKRYLINDGWADRTAGLIMMACFVGGFFGIQIISRLLHQYIPSHVVGCDHTHAGASASQKRSRSHSHSHGHGDSHDHRHSRRSLFRNRSSHAHEHKTIKNGTAISASESTPLLTTSDPEALRRHASARGDEMEERPPTPLNVRGRARTDDPNAMRKPSIFQVQKRVMSFVKDTKCGCDESGSCYGYTDPCGQECFKHLTTHPSQGSSRASVLQTTTGPFYPHTGSMFQGGRPQPDEELGEEGVGPHFRTSRATSREPLSLDEDDTIDGQGDVSSSTEDVDEADEHHHHVPTNAFLSIGLQTSIAIALHKFPEGFITYATNHASPALGFNVFMALFVHNISEGFAMALPLYMALGSRWKAMIWSSLLGGLSQPMGAGLAALWFGLASHNNVKPSPVVYACLFAITAGIMVSVALQLFVESLSLNHNRNLCIFFGFIGMAILGLSNALFGGH
ncbi:unnamed protein product [Clonostachys rosea f. rosea IK726]|uniref:Uncharacterized protein n=3 Tax=Bionectria ochroleuca TaxID=29856 RepID=A0A0B7JSF0_BIOOC|nr:unnamed protein product [Clonostachys rosea f. rosea IK726]